MVNPLFHIVLQVNCAGVIEFGSIENTSLEQYDRVFNINVRCVMGIKLYCQCCSQRQRTVGQLDLDSKYNGQNVLAAKKLLCPLEDIKRVKAIDILLSWG